MMSVAAIPKLLSNLHRELIIPPTIMWLNFDEQVVAYIK